MNPRFRTLTLWATIILGFVLFAQVLKGTPGTVRLTITELITLGETGNLPENQEENRAAIVDAKITQL
ncbi:MAG: hypothetical protein ACOC2L_01410, partial [Candidatus Sumerlaeota bacterium]